MSEPVEAGVERVGGDVLCRQCGYNLRGLAVAGKCPECGAAVGNSIHGDLLQFSSVAWLEKVRLGFTLMLWGIVVQLVGGIGGLILLRLMSVRNGVLSEAWVMAAGMVSLGGVWLMTEPDPADRFARQEGSAVSARSVARVAMIAALCLSAARIGTTIATVGDVAVILDQVVYFIHQVTSLIGTLAELTYIARLARRIPKPELVRRAKQLRTAFGIASGLAITMITLLQWVLTGPSRAGLDMAEVLGCFVTLVGLAVLVTAIMEILLMVRMRRALNVPLYVARGNQAAAGGPESFPDTPHP